MSKLLITLNSVFELILPNDLTHIIFEYTPVITFKKIKEFKHYNNAIIIEGIIAVDYDNMNAKIKKRTKIENMKTTFNIFKPKNLEACVYVLNLSDYKVDSYRISDNKHVKHESNNYHDIYGSDIKDFCVTSKCKSKYFLCAKNKRTHLCLRILSGCRSVELDYNPDEMFVMKNNEEIIFVEDDVKRQKIIGSVFLLSEFDVTYTNINIITFISTICLDDAQSIITKLYFMTLENEYIYVGSKTWFMEKDKKFSAILVANDNTYFLYVLRKDCVQIYEKIDLYT